MIDTSPVLAEPLSIIFSKGIKFKPDPRFRPDVYYSIRRLNFPDATSVADMFASLLVNFKFNFENLSKQLKENDSLENSLNNLTVFVTSLMWSAPDVADKVYSLLSKFVLDHDQNPLTMEDLKNPEKLPLPATVTLVQALIKHPDIVDFLVLGHQMFTTLVTQNPQLADFLEKAQQTLVGNQENTV